MAGSDDEGTAESGRVVQGIQDFLRGRSHDTVLSALALLALAWADLAVWRVTGLAQLQLAGIVLGALLFICGGLGLVLMINLHTGRREPGDTLTAGIILALGGVVAASIGILFVVIPRPLLSVFGMHDGVVVDLGVELLGYLAISGLFVTVALAYTGGLQGTGDTRSPLYISIISQVVMPLGICAAVQATSGLESHDIWLAIVIGHVTRAVLSVIRFRQGKWRDIRVDIGSAQA